MFQRRLTHKITVLALLLSITPSTISAKGEENENNSKNEPKMGFIEYRKSERDHKPTFVFFEIPEGQDTKKVVKDRVEKIFQDAKDANEEAPTCFVFVKDKKIIPNRERIGENDDPFISFDTLDDMTNNTIGFDFDIDTYSESKLLEFFVSQRGGSYNLNIVENGRPPWFYRDDLYRPFRQAFKNYYYDNKDSKIDNSAIMVLVIGLIIVGGLYAYMNSPEKVENKKPAAVTPTTPQSTLVH